MRMYLSSFRLGNRPEEMIALLRGGRRAAAICNADDYKTPGDRVTGVQRELDDLAGLGLDPFEVDLRDHFGDPSGVRVRLEAYDLIWVRGGNPYILRRAMSYSGADKALTDLIATDAIVYAGYSAGVVILTANMRGIDLVDDPDDVPAGYQSEVLWDGLGLLPYNVVPHFRSAHPESLAVDKVAELYLATHTPFIALRDGEAIVRDGTDEDRFVG